MNTKKIALAVLLILVAVAFVLVMRDRGASGRSNGESAVNMNQQTVAPRAAQTQSNGASTAVIPTGSGSTMATPGNGVSTLPMNAASSAPDSAAATGVTVPPAASANNAAATGVTVPTAAGANSAAVTGVTPPAAANVPGTAPSAPDVFIPTKKSSNTQHAQANDDFSIPTKARHGKAPAMGKGPQLKLKSKDEMDGLKPKSYSGNPEDLLLDGEKSLDHPQD